MQKAKGNHHKMSKTPEGRPSSADVKNNYEKLSVLGKLGQVAVEAAGVVKRTWRAMIGRDYDEYAANDSLVPEVSEPPKPTPIDILINEQKDKARDEAAKHSDNPEGLTPYEQAMRDKYLGNKYDEAEYGDDEPEKDESYTKANTEKTEMSADEHEAAALLKVARERFAKASIAVETHFFKGLFGGKKRQEELNAATEELKKSELEYMRIKFADEIEAAK